MQTLTNIPLHSLNVPIQMLQVRGKVSIASEVKEAGKRPHAKPPAVIVDPLEPELSAIINQLLEHWVKGMGMVPVGQLWVERKKMLIDGGR